MNISDWFDDVERSVTQIRSAAVDVHSRNTELLTCPAEHSGYGLEHNKNVNKVIFVNKN